MSRKCLWCSGLIRHREWCPKLEADQMSDYHMHVRLSSENSCSECGADLSPAKNKTLDEIIEATRLNAVWNECEKYAHKAGGLTPHEAKTLILNKLLESLPAKLKYDVAVALRDGSYIRGQELKVEGYNKALTEVTQKIKDMK